MNSVKSKRVKKIPSKYYRDRQKFFSKMRQNLPLQCKMVNRFVSNLQINELSSYDDNEIHIFSSHVSPKNTNDSSPQLNNVNNIQNSFEPATDDVQERIVQVTDENDCEPTLQFKLQQWALNFNVNRNAVSSLLSILRSFNQNLPKDSRTLLNTPRQVMIEDLGIGKFWYHSIQSCLLHSIFANWPHDITLGVNFNMDGLQLYQSSTLEFWPIIMNIAEMPEVKTMIIAIYYGRGKPPSSEQFLRRFTTEFNELHTNGMQTSKGATVKIRLNAIICDAPAKAFVKCMYAKSID